MSGTKVTVTDEQNDMIDRLEATGAFRVLRAIEAPQLEPGTLRPTERIAIIVDTETTGLDLRDDEVVEIGIVAITYDQSDNFVRVIGLFEGLREPDNPMSPDAINITGLSPEMLKGKTINQAALRDIVEKASLVIAHNAAFDRPMCEKLHPAFAEKAWACSATEIPWRTLGYEGAKLGYLLYQSGLFHKGHRALEDCYALLSVLNVPQKKSEMNGLQLLLRSARQTRVLLEATAPFELRAFFKNRGFRWRSHPVRRWIKEVSEVESETEVEEIRRLRSPNVEVRLMRLTAFDRYKAAAY
ncbi:DNA polymerase-3 subunit epsilon [Sinorhizobium fredii]